MVFVSRPLVMFIASRTQGTEQDSTSGLIVHCTVPQVQNYFITYSPTPQILKKNLNASKPSN